MTFIVDPGIRGPMQHFILSVFALFMASQAYAERHPGLRIAEAWDTVNAPSILDPSYRRVFDEMPLSAQAAPERMPWADSYWPSQKGSIAYRWNASVKVGFKYRSPSLSQLKAMSEAQIAELSPAEKYDIFMGHYDYPLLQEVWGNSSPRAKSWAGICHGWAPASMHTQEPKPVTLVNADGIRIPFGSADVKGLLSYYYAFHAKTPVKQLGRRCFFPGGPFRALPACQDANAGSFHIVLANHVGFRREPFLMEGDRMNEIWNYAVYGYESKVLATGSKVMGSASGTVKRVLVNTTVHVPEDNADQIWGATLGTSQYPSRTFEYEYWLELDAWGNILGGEYTSFDRPDFLWSAEKATSFNAPLNGLEQIYPASLTQ